MDIKAHARFIRMAPRKVRLVANTIKGLPVSAARVRLSFLPKAAVTPVQKLLASAIANAEHNFSLKQEALFVKSITVDGGPTLKRFHPRAFGRTAPILKRTSHISILLSDEKPVSDKKIKKKRL